MESRARHYLDHAATSWPKPPGSLQACIDFQTHLGAAAGRGVYRNAEESNRLLQQARASVARLIHAQERSVAFCGNGTQALNAAIQGLLRSDTFRECHVVTTATEHNSVLRPLALLAKSKQMTWTAVSCNRDGMVDPSNVQSAMRRNTRLVIVNHASNVTGAIQDIAAIAAIAHSHHAIFLVDAAQTLGYLPTDVNSQGIDILAAPGHKGAGGMLGTGILFVREAIQPFLEPLWIGGTGTQSDSIDGPFDWLSAVESGNSNLPAIASLKAGVDWVINNSSIGHLNDWTQEIIEAIQRQPSIRLIGGTKNRMPVISLTSSHASCHEMAMLLDSACHVEARSGFHCAGLIHEHLGTQSCGGTLRLSLGHTSTRDDVDAAVRGIETLAQFAITMGP
ncbi:MAG: aminotransferase class V-fold PLP-dependent enzyme [Pirellula sp.]